MAMLNNQMIRYKDFPHLMCFTSPGAPLLFRLRLRGCLGSDLCGRIRWLRLGRAMVEPGGENPHDHISYNGVYIYTHTIYIYTYYIIYIYIHTIYIYIYGLYIYIYVYIYICVAICKNISYIFLTSYQGSLFVSKI